MQPVSRFYSRSPTRKRFMSQGSRADSRQKRLDQFPLKPVFLPFVLALCAETRSISACYTDVLELQCTSMISCRIPTTFEAAFSEEGTCSRSSRLPWRFVCAFRHSRRRPLRPTRSDQPQPA